MHRAPAPLTTDLLLQAYAAGVFPMADSAEDARLRWFDPPVRALIPLDERFHVPRRLRRTLRQRRFTVTLNQAFHDVLRACAAPAPDRPKTWINAPIVEAYTALHREGHAHSVEVWQGERLTGGLYGVALGGAFFGESMFSHATDASKIALTYLVALLKTAGFALLDTQFQTDHLARFGTFEITRDAYHLLLRSALRDSPTLPALAMKDWAQRVESLLQPMTQTS